MVTVHHSGQSEEGGGGGCLHCLAKPKLKFLQVEAEFMFSSRVGNGLGMQVLKKHFYVVCLSRW